MYVKEYHQWHHKDVTARKVKCSNKLPVYEKTPD